MPSGSFVWKFKSVPKIYWEEASRKSALTDEKNVINYIKNSGEIKIVSLGIGPGRELTWLRRLKNVGEIIGIDYSQPMLIICREVADYLKLKVVLIKDDLLYLKKAKKITKKESLPLFYICLINSLGNFLAKNRIKVLKIVKGIMKKGDRLIVCLDKRPWERRGKIFRTSSYLKIKNRKKEGRILGEILEYSSFALFWDPILKKQYSLPRFWYDEKNNDIVVYAGKNKVFISHRFAKEEIEKLYKKAGLKIEKLIGGKAMYTVISKI